MEEALPAVLEVPLLVPLDLVPVLPVPQALLEAQDQTPVLLVLLDPLDPTLEALEAQALLAPDPTPDLQATLVRPAHPVDLLLPVELLEEE